MTKKQLTSGLKAVVLVGPRDFGRCPLASQKSTALWPIVDKPALYSVLDQLIANGIDSINVALQSEDREIITALENYNSPKVNYSAAKLPTGTAGAIRDAINPKTDKLIFVLPASVISVPNINSILQAYNQAQTIGTVLFEPTENHPNQPGKCADMYLFNADVVKHIPPDGYFDIKEGLIPALSRIGQSPSAAILEYPTGSFRDRKSYIKALARSLTENHNQLIPENLTEDPQNPSLWKHPDAQIHQSARIIGPAVIMKNAKIGPDTVLTGPVIIGPDTDIAKGAMLDNCITWDHAKIQPYTTKYNTVISGQKPKNPILPQSLNNKKVFAAAMAVLAVILLWSYWPVITGLWRMWMRSDEYGSGLFVPFIAIYVLWIRREELKNTPTAISIIGLLGFLASQAFLFFGRFFYFDSAERLALVGTIAAAALWLFGWRIIGKIYGVMAFLILMVPLPRRMDEAIALPLQSLATKSAVFCLEMLGYAVIREGNVIRIGQTTVAVAEACNGLRMITAFFVIAGLIALVINRSVWEKAFIVISALPIAILCNTIRLTATSIAFTYINVEKWQQIFHDYGGYAMMPLALAIVLGELWILKNLFITEDKKYNKTQPDIIVAGRNS